MSSSCVIHAICLDCGDTLADERTEIKDAHGVTLKADLIPGAAEMVRAIKQRGYPQHTIQIL